jgi:hypothetical protein
MNPLLISALIAGALGFGSAWTWQGYRQDAYKLEISNERIATEAANRKALADAQSKVTAAQAESQAATDRVKRDAVGASRSAVGVRDSLANAVRTAATDLTSCTAQVATLSELLAGSTDLARRLATEADDWAIQAVTLQQAWPK